MLNLLALLALTRPEDRLRIEGPPFLVHGESVELRALSGFKDAVVVWRLADGPASSIHTQPSLDTATRIVRGADLLKVTSMGKSDEEMLFSVTVERKGV